MPENGQTSPESKKPKVPWRDPARLAYLANNPLSWFGFLMVGLGLILLVTFAIFVIVSPTVNPYVGILGYGIFPGIFITGLVLVPLGMLLKQWRRRRYLVKHPGEVAYPRIDLNNPSTRRWILSFTLFSAFVVLPAVGVSSYYGYLWTESKEFCGRLCHSVMEPQDTAHSRSSHARVVCAECHIGAGASWFVKSKVTGLGQVIAVATNSYPRPIPNAIENLRPARETCEECHWPARFFGSQYRELVQYASDEANTRRVFHMMLKTGGADWLTGRVEGIHMHMILYGEIEYVALDPDLQQVPWVRHTLPTGEALIYRSDGQPTSAPAPEGLVRDIDCMDCHNRAAHRFRAPQDSLDLYMIAGRIDAGLPFVKREAVAALVGDYANREEALQGIERRLTGFYQQQYPQIAANRRPEIEKAISAVQQIYQQDFFPHMRENWRVYPSNIGHKNSPGCFRCHDGLHVNQHGHAIRSNCVMCHVFLNPVEGRPNELVEGPFNHPMDLTPHANLRCEECHTGGVLLLCRDCHASGEWLAHRGKTAFRREDQ